MNLKKKNAHQKKFYGKGLRRLKYGGKSTFIGSGFFGCTRLGKRDLYWPPSKESLKLNIRKEVKRLLKSSYLLIQRHVPVPLLCFDLLPILN